jgi:hypothetical protein
MKAIDTIVRAICVVLLATGCVLFIADEGCVDGKCTRHIITRAAADTCCTDSFGFRCVGHILVTASPIDYVRCYWDGSQIRSIARHFESGNITASDAVIALAEVVTKPCLWRDTQRRVSFGRRVGEVYVSLLLGIYKEISHYVVLYACERYDLSSGFPVGRDPSCDDQLITSLTHNDTVRNVSMKIKTDMWGIEKRLIKTHPEMRSFLFADDVSDIVTHIESAKALYPDLLPLWEGFEGRCGAMLWPTYMWIRASTAFWTRDVCNKSD